MDQAEAPTRRRGIEVSAQYRPYPWKADAFDYDYPTRLLPGDPAGGLSDERRNLQFHPLEPISARLMLTQSF